MPTVKVFNTQGEIVNEIELDEAVFGIEPNKQTMFDMVLLQRASIRQGTHATKGRSDVRGGGRKPWRQKGTGRARQGSTRAPQWRGGGTVFGPQPRSYGFKLNKKVARLALKSALSTKVIDEEIKVLNEIGFETPKTKNMVNVLANLKAEGKTLLVMDEVTENVALAARNIPHVMVLDAAGINVYDIMNSNNLVVTEAAVKKIEGGLK